MAESFYNKITQKVGRGSWCRPHYLNLLEAQHRRLGDSLKEDQAVQDYQKSQAGSELGQSLTKAAGDAALCLWTSQKRLSD